MKDEKKEREMDREREEIVSMMRFVSIQKENIQQLLTASLKIAFVATIARRFRFTLL